MGIGLDKVFGSGNGYAGDTSAASSGTLKLWDTSGHVNLANNWGSGAIKFTVGASERLRIDASGNLGLGVVPSAWSNYKAAQFGYSGGLSNHVNLNYLRLESNSFNGGSGETYLQSGHATKYAQNNGSGIHAWSTAPSGTAGSTIPFTQAMTLDASGNLLVGKTADNWSTTGVQAHGYGVLVASRNGHTLNLNRETTDGDIARFQKNGTTVGSIGTEGSDICISGAATDHVGLRMALNTILPMKNGTITDAAVDLGQQGANYRFKDLYLSGGVYLGGTGAANKLADYEEGSFTPQVADAESGGNEATYTRNYGYYTKVGRQVTIIIELTNIDTTGLTAGNDLHITGLPFAAHSVTGAVRWIGAMQQNYISLNASTPYLTPTVYETATTVFISENGDNSGGDSVIVSQLISGTADINITLTYFTS